MFLVDRFVKWDHVRLGQLRQRRQCRGNVLARHKVGERTRGNVARWKLRAAAAGFREFEDELGGLLITHGS